MSGIAGAAEYIVKSREPSCIKCGRKFRNIGRHGKKLGCLPIMQAVHGIGVVAWCSRECVDEWNILERGLVPKMIEALRGVS
mgnify:CR=1 FL=1